MTDTKAPLTRIELDKLVEQGCTHPSCKAQGHQRDNKHGHPLFLHAGCHPKSSTVVRYYGDGVLEIRCKVENRFVGSIAIDPRQAAQMTAKVVCDDPNCEHPLSAHSLIFKPPCHRQAGAFAVYANGHLAIQCASCKRVLETFHVSEGASA